MKYGEYLKASKEAIKDLQVPFKVRKAKKELEGEIIDLEQSISEAELDIEETKSAHPFELSKILKAIDTKEIKERKLRQANKLLNELFD